MERYVGLDVSLKQTAVCIVDQAGMVVKEGVVPCGTRGDRSLHQRSC
jgi:hypothetical protein